MFARLVFVLVLSMGIVTACGGDDSAPDANATATREVELAELATVNAAQGQATEARSTEEKSTEPPAATATDAPTATATETPQPTASPTPRLTRTPAPTATPEPIDLGTYLPIGTDMAGPFTIIDEQPADQSLFVYDEGFVQGKTRSLAKDDPPAAAAAYCAEYGTVQQALESLEQQYTAMMQNTESFTLVDDDNSQIDTENAHLAGGTAHLSEGDRVTAIVWFQTGRVMCYFVALGVPDGDSPPYGFAIDAANGVLGRLAQAAAPTPTPIPGGPDVFNIGQKISYEDGFSITVLTVEDPVVVNNEAVSPGDQLVLVAVEVEACAGSSTTDASFGPLDVEVSLDDNTRADRSYSLVKQPELDSASLFPGECLRGWVTFERHWKPRAVYVVIDPQGYTTVRVKAR